MEVALLCLSGMRPFYKVEGSSEFLRVVAPRLKLCSANTAARAAVPIEGLCVWVNRDQLACTSAPYFSSLSVSVPSAACENDWATACLTSSCEETMTL